MYEFAGQNPGVVRGGEVQFQVSEFFEPIGMFQRSFPWARFKIIGTKCFIYAVAFSSADKALLAYTR